MVAAEPTGGLFARYEVATGAGRQQTVLPGFFLGGATAEFAVVHVGEDGVRGVRVYGFEDGAWGLVLEAPLGPGVVFVDVANIGGRDRLLTCESGGVSWFDPDTATARPLVAFVMEYSAADQDGIPHVDITRDVNGDGQDDLVAPGVDGFWVSIQMAGGVFTDAVKLGPAEPFLNEIVMGEKRRYGDAGFNALTIPWYLSRVHMMDYNRDGRSDLVFWNEDHFDVYYQNAGGLFPPVADSFTVDVPFDSDGVYSLAFGFADESGLALIFGFRKKTRRTVLHGFRDVNGDHVADLVTLSAEGRSPMRQRGTHEVHFGMPTAGGIRFAREVGAAARSPGRASGLRPWGYASQWLGDFDGDDQVDVMLRDVNTGLGGIVRALLGNSVAMDLAFYRLEDGVYPNQPNTMRRIRPALNPLGKRGPFFPAARLGDVNGDGRSDLLVGNSRQELHVFLGVPGSALFAREPVSVAVAVPDDEERTRLADLNGDGKQDVFMHHLRRSGPHLLVMLIAR